MRLVVLFGVLCALFPAFAMMRAVSPQELVATSDVIVVGTVLSDTRLPNVANAFAGQATITVNRVLRGPQQLETITLRHAVPPVMEPGRIIVDHGGIMLVPGQQRLFFLTRGRDGYILTGGSMGMVKPEDTERFSQMMAAPALTATFTQPVRPIFFNKPFEVKVTVQNATDTAYTLYQPRLVGYYYSSLLDPYLVIGMHMVETKPTMWTVKAGEAVTISTTLTYAVPNSWQAFAPESYMLTPVAVRGELFVQSAAPGAPGYPIVTPWHTVLLGYPPPADAYK